MLIASRIGQKPFSEVSSGVQPQVIASATNARADLRSPVIKSGNSFSIKVSVFTAKPLLRSKPLVHEATILSKTTVSLGVPTTGNLNQGQLYNREIPHPRSINSRFLGFVAISDEGFLPIAY